MASETRFCVLCDRDGATFAESWQVGAFVNDEFGTLPSDMVHMLQSDEYWFDEIDCNDADFAKRIGCGFPFQQYGCHMRCYLRWLRANLT